MPVIVGSGTAAAPPAATVVSPDGKLTLTSDNTYGGIEIVANFSSLTPKPIRVRLERADGSRVRSGDPAEAPGGIGYGYEHEAQLGVGWALRAVPIFAYTSTAVTVGDGTTMTGKQPEDAGSYADYALASSFATIVVPEPAGMFDFWVKSLAAPSLSILLSGRLPLLSEGETARFEATELPRFPYPVGPYDVRTITPISIVFAVETLARRQQFAALRAAGPVLVQPRAGYLDDGDFYALPGDSSSVPIKAQWDPRRDVTVAFQPISRPPTVDTPLSVPGYSIDEAYALAPTISQAAITWPTIANASGY